MPIWRSIAKSVTWRVIGVFLLGGIAFVFTDNLAASLAVTLAFNGIRVVLYVIHEEAWERWRPLAKLGRYEPRSFPEEAGEAPE